jgi:L-threonate 2-dehydrogenase
MVTERVGVIGLGTMGSGMARNLIRAGNEVTGFDVDPERVASFEASGGKAAASTGEAAAISSLVVLSLPTEDALQRVAIEIAAEAGPGLLCLETGTFSLEAKQNARATLAATGIELMDTPLSGTGLQAADGTLVVFASGGEEGYRRAAGVLAAISRSTHYLGEFGNGSKMKYVANLLVAIHNLVTAEAHGLGVAAGLDPSLVQEVMSDGVGSSKIFEIRGPMIVNNDYTPSARLDLMVKDSAIIKQFAADSGAVTPLLDAAIPVYIEASKSGLGGLDAASLYLYLQSLVGKSGQ